MSMRAQLPRAYGAFLGRFDGPTDIQRQAIPALLAGRDALLCAPTASGKTEAYAAPCAERLLDVREGTESSQWLLVSPTRALANDLFRRLQASLDTLHVTLGRYTGEHKERTPARWPRAMVVTPESLDSLLARRPQVLAAVRMVVIDEVHVLDGTVRGDQLRILLERLDRATENPVQRIAASATVDHSESLAARYLHEPVLCIARGDRKVKARSFAGTDPAATAAHLRELAKAGLRKILIFVPGRADVDQLATALRGQAPFGERIFAHHGSLSKAVRERSERQFHDAPAAVAIATTTLELGIDIGSVDYVLILSPPASVASLMQRIGRGGRRRDTIRFGYAWRNPGEELRFQVMARAGLHGEYLEQPYGFRASVLVQQALCLAAARGYVTPDAIEALLPEDLREQVSREDLREMFARLVERNWLEPGRGGRYLPGEDLEARYERGSLHSNLADSPGLDLVDRLTGEVLGQVASGPGGPSELSLAGSARRVVRESEGRILTDASGPGGLARYRGGSSPVTSFALGRAMARAIGAEDNGLLLVRGQDGLRAVHGLGTVGGLYFAHLLADQGLIVDAKSVRAVGLAFMGTPGPWSDPGPAAAEDFLRRHRRRLERLAGMGPFQNELGRGLADRSLFEASGLHQVQEFLARAQWQGPVEVEALESALLYL
ncbi:MAG: DEAD/DEAH box helicase [Planctomycetota bacterium]